MAVSSAYRDEGGLCSPFLGFMRRIYVHVGFHAGQYAARHVADCQTRLSALHLPSLFFALSSQRRNAFPPFSCRFRFVA